MRNQARGRERSTGSNRTGKRGAALRTAAGRRRGRSIAAAVVPLMLAGLLASAGAAHAASDSWSAAGALSTPRIAHTATLLGNGKVLVAGGTGASAALASAELYDPGTNDWTAGGTLGTGRYRHASTLLGNGKVLVTGGSGGSSDLASAELYNPATNSWSPAEPMAAVRTGHTATLLENGKVLVAGGKDGEAWEDVLDAELYDPATNSWSPAGTMSAGHELATATLLSNGKVLVVGGYSIATGSTVASAELYDPATNSWSPAGALARVRAAHTATLLPNGKVLVAGGTNGGTPYSTAELYNPSTNSWSPAESMSTARHGTTATRLHGGKVFVAGGHANGELSSAELYDAKTDSWSPAAGMENARYSHTAVLLANDKVLVAGGYTPCSDASCHSSSVLIAEAERYSPAATVPDAPTGVTANAGNASATVSWNAPESDGGSPISGYTVTSSPGAVTATTGGSARSVTVNGLINGTSYTFTVKATNARGDGPVSDPSNAVTPQAPSTAGTKNVGVYNYYFSPKAPVVPQGSTVRWTINQGTHTATDSSGMAYFNSGPMSAGQTFSHTFTAAGSYKYRSTASGDPSTMVGTIKVPLKVSPLSGGTSTSYTVTWASAPPEAGFFSEVQVRSKPCAKTATCTWRAWGTWKANQTSALSAAYTPTNGAGTYQFRARFGRQLPGTTTKKFSLWSAPVTVSVT